MSDDHLTREQLSSALPAKYKAIVTQELVDDINMSAVDEEHARTVRENFISYRNVLADGQYRLSDYLNAVKFVSYRLMGLTARECYDLTFPDRIARHRSAMRSNKEISAYVTAYTNGELYGKVLKQSIMPTWVLNNHVKQDAINKLVDLMENSPSDKVRCDAALGLLSNLKEPEAKEVNLNIGLADDSGLNALKHAQASLAEKLQEAISGGVPIERLLDQRIIDVVPTEVTDVY